MSLFPYQREAVEWLKDESYTFIYGLIHPDDLFLLKNIKYVGKSNDPRRRLNNHIYASASPKSNPQLYAWIRAIKDSGKKPCIAVLERCIKHENKIAEKKWISILRKQLLNITPGGNGCDGGYKQSSLTCIKKSLAIRFNLPDRKIISAYSSGKSLSEVGKMFGVHINTIRRRLLAHGVKPRTISDAKAYNLPIEKVIQLYNSGKTAKEVGVQFGVTSMPIYRILKKNKVVRSRSESNRLASLKRYADASSKTSNR